MVVEADVEDRCGIPDLAGDIFVLRAWAQIAGRVIVEQDHGRGKFFERPLYYEAHVHISA